MLIFNTLIQKMSNSTKTPDLTFSGYFRVTLKSPVYSPSKILGIFTYFALLFQSTPYQFL